jgi:hypothetical protein
MEEKTTYVIGVFDCGCLMESSVSSVEIVTCSSRKEADTVEKLMKRHSAAYQCHPKEAWSTSVFGGELVKTDLKDAVKLTEGEEFGVFTFSDYLKKWRARDIAARKTERELKEYKRKFDRRMKKASKPSRKQGKKLA